jgi:hypothetical protein
MVDTSTAQKVKPFVLLILGSSSIERENGGGVMHHHHSRNRFSERAVPHDTASHANAISLEFASDTYVEETSFPEEMIEHDIYVAMAPRAKYTIQAKIRSVRKAEPLVVVPESPFVDF